MVAERGLLKEVRINSAGCLGACEQGQVMVIYPQGVYYGGITEYDLEEILQKSILNDEIISRLVIEK